MRLIPEQTTTTTARAAHPRMVIWCDPIEVESRVVLLNWERALVLSHSSIGVCVSMVHQQGSIKCILHFNVYTHTHILLTTGEHIDDTRWWYHRIILITNVSIMYIDSLCTYNPFLDCLWLVVLLLSTYTYLGDGFASCFSLMACTFYSPIYIYYKTRGLMRLSIDIQFISELRNKYIY